MNADGPNPTHPAPLKLHVQQRGTWRTMDLSTREVFAFRGESGLSFTHVAGPGAVLSLRPTPGGILATPATPGATINGEPLQRPRLLGKFDLLELADALLRSEVDESEPLQAASGLHPDAPAPPAASGAFAGRYELKEQLGRGGFGVVYKAWDTKLQRSVAIKVLVRAEGRALQRFAMEIRATAALKHPNLITVFDSGIVDAHPYLVMELVEGKTLDQLGKDGIPHSQLAAILCDVTRAVAYAHQQGLLHRDIKPQNVLVRTDGHPVLLDFGLVRVIGAEEHSRITRSGTRLGTLPYMSPEQAFASEIDERSEVYALGASLYHALVGRYPFQEAGDDILVAVVNQEPIPPSRLRAGIPPDLEAICLKCMEKRQRDRYPTAAALAADLQRFLDGEPTAARPLGPIHRKLRRLRRDRQAQLLLAATLVVLTLLGSWAVVYRSQQDKLRVKDERLAKEEAERELRLAKEAEAERRRREAVQEEARAKEAKAVELRGMLEGIVDRPQGVDKELAVYELVKAGEDPAVGVLCEWLDALSSDMLKIEADVLRGAGEARTGELPIEHLDDAITARTARPPLTPLTKKEEIALDAAQERIRQRAKSEEHFLRLPSLPVILTGRQRQEIPAGRFLAAEVACRALGRLHAQEALPVLARYLHAEWDPLQASAPALALSLLEAAQVFDHLLAAYNRFGVDSIFARRVAPALKAHANAESQSLSTAEGYLRRAQFYRSIGDAQSCLADSNKALQLDPQYDEAYMMRSIARMDLDDLDGARADLDRAIELLPLASEPWNNRSNLRLMQGDVKGALVDATQAAKLNPGNHLAYFNMGQAAKLLGQPNAALAAFSKALTLEPTYAGAWAERAVLRRDAGDLSGALLDVERALALDPKDADAWSTAHLIHFDRGDVPAALEAVSRAIDLQPRRALHRYHRALCYQRLGNTKQALQDAEAAVQRARPAALPWALVGRARCYVAMGDKEKALADLDWALQQDPNEMNGRKMRASIYSRYGPTEKAIPDLEFIAKAEPGEPQVWSMLADLHYRSKQFEKGDEALRRAQALAPNSVGVLSALVIRHLKVGKLEEALALCNKLTLLAPQQVYVWQQRAAVLLALGKLEEAVSDYEKFLEVAPNAPEAEEMRKKVVELRARLAKEKGS